VHTEQVHTEAESHRLKAARLQSLAFPASCLRPCSEHLSHAIATLRAHIGVQEVQV